MENPFKHVRPSAYAMATGCAANVTGLSLVLAAGKKYGEARDNFGAATFDAAEAALHTGDKLMAFGGPLTLGGLAVTGVSAAVYLLGRTKEPKR